MKQTIVVLALFLAIFLASPVQAQEVSLTPEAKMELIKVLQAKIQELLVKLNAAIAIQGQTRYDVSLGKVQDTKAIEADNTARINPPKPVTTISIGEQQCIGDSNRGQFFSWRSFNISGPYTKGIVRYKITTFDGAVLSSGGSEWTYNQSKVLNYKSDLYNRLALGEGMKFSQGQYIVYVELQDKDQATIAKTTQTLYASDCTNPTTYIPYDFINKDQF